MEGDYIKRVQRLALLDPSVNRVLQYINKSPTQGSLDHESIRAVLFDHANHASSSSGWHTFEGAASSLEQLGRAIRSTSSARTTLIVRDLQPAAMLYLGALLNIKPVCFEHYLNRDASFDTFDPAVLVFDYPETLLYQGGNRTALERTLPKASEGHGRGTVVKNMDELICVLSTSSISQDLQVTSAIRYTPAVDRFASEIESLDIPPGSKIVSNVAQSEA